MLDKTNEVTPSLVRSFEIFSRLGDKATIKLAGQSLYTRLKRGQCIIERGDMVEGFYGIDEGQIKLYLLSCNGHERIIRIVGKGECFGEDIMFNESPSPIYAEALNGCKLAFFPKAPTLETVLSRPSVGIHMIKAMSRLMQELIQDLEDCCTRTAQQRIAHYLIKSIKDSSCTQSEITLPASKSAIASTLNLSPETFSRELHELQHKELISISRKIIHLHDIATLKTIAEPPSR